MLSLVVLSTIVTFVACAVLSRLGRENASRYSLQMPQRFHMGDIPRLGGAAMALGCSAGWIWGVIMGSSAWGLSPGVVVGAWVAMAVAAGTGLAEDITHCLAARTRLLLTILAAALATAWLGLHIGPLGLPWLEPLWATAPWVGTLLAVIAVAGLPNAFNLIDGYNGLAGMTALVCCLVIAWVALQVGDRELAGLMLATAGATIGFLAWNYPRGLIFAGDGGAYLWGAVIAVASVMLVQRHEAVSPWFPALLLVYPVWETFFSIYRKLARGQSPSAPDALHFHQLVYRRVVRPGTQSEESLRLLTRNNRTAPYLWVLVLMSAVPATLFWRDTGTLMAFCALFVFTYVTAYVGMVRFKVPGWLRR